jgi:hypothetical protein
MRHNARATFFGEKIQMAKVVVFEGETTSGSTCVILQSPGISTELLLRAPPKGFRQRNEYLRGTWRLKPFSRSRRGHTAARAVETPASATRTYG